MVPSDLLLSRVLKLESHYCRVTLEGHNVIFLLYFQIWGNFSKYTQATQSLGKW